MNDVLLIKKTNLADKYSIGNMTFIIKDIHKNEVQEKVIQMIHKYSELNQFILKYNGFEMKIKYNDIPNLLGDLCKQGIKVYGVYELYDK
ncbi:MAG: hypothetical protein Q4P28_00150 [Tissierellia bacterium]|nr:hypothetical protein [Tissierellia bacterium]